MYKSAKEFSESLYFCTHQVSPRMLGRSFFLGKIVLIFCHQGSMELVVGNESHHLTPEHMIFLHPHAEITLLHYSDDIQITAIGFMMGLQESVLHHIDPGFFAYILKTPCWKLDIVQQRAVGGFCDSFDYICNHIESPLKAEMISNLFTVFLQVFYENTQHFYASHYSDVSISAKSIVLQFIQQLGKHFKEEHSVAYYASLLCISPKYLTQTVKKRTGNTPKELIDKRLAVESLYLLKSSDKTIQEVGIMLGFPDQSYFGRFFKRMFGMSPLSYRLNPDMDLMRKLRLSGQYEERELLE